LPYNVEDSCIFENNLVQESKTKIEDTSMKTEELINSNQDDIKESASEESDEVVVAEQGGTAANTKPTP